MHSQSVGTRAGGLHTKYIYMFVPFFSGGCFERTVPALLSTPGSKTQPMQPHTVHVGSVSKPSSDLLNRSIHATLYAALRGG